MKFDLQRFRVLNANINADIVHLAVSLGEQASQIFDPSEVLVIDESIYEYKSPDCPVTRYFPRKPHPNGLCTYGLASALVVDGRRLPILMDIEPVTLGNEVSAQEAMMRLQSRLHNRFPQRRFHLVVDAAFGSVERIQELDKNGSHHISAFLTFRLQCDDEHVRESPSLALGHAQ